MSLSLHSSYAQDRFQLTLLISVIFHILVVLGLGFAYTLPSHDRDAVQQFDLTLVERGDRVPPKHPDYLAQANQQGGGNTSERGRPSAPPPAPVGQDQAGDAERTQHASVARPPEPAAAALTVDQASPTHIQAGAETAPADAGARNAAELLQRWRQVARLSAEYSDVVHTYSRNLRQTYVEPNTRAYNYASYIEGYRAKVEHIGNLNYPDEAKRRHLTGQLRLDVGINADGTIYDIQVRRSSGNKTLDDAAKNIVRLAGPFAPLPDEIRRDTDVLHIEHEWQFMVGDRLETSR